MEPFHLPITDVLDLHTFRPSELPMLIEDYLEACLDQGFASVRIVHGKGKGILRDRLYRLLERDPRVRSFHPAPPDAGGWGAVIVVLEPGRPPAQD
ncbi:MAG: Smr/MutS family protein [Desulfobacterales bacterium]